MEQCLSWLNEVSQRFQDDGLLNDHAYAKALVHSFRRRGLSTKLISQKLRHKGITAELANETLTRFDEHTLERAQDSHLVHSPDFLAALRFSQRKKIGSFSRLSHEDIDNETAAKLHNKALGQLARAGFSYDIAKQALETPLDEAQMVLAASL